MPVVTYRYKQLKSLRVPIVTLAIRYGERWHPVEAYVDSGATYSVFTVQVGAFVNRESARDLARRLGVVFDHVEVTRFVDEQNRVLHRVRVTRSSSLDEASKREEQLEEMGFVGSFVVRI